MVSDLLSPSPTVRGRYGPVALVAGAATVAVAGALHLAVVPEHLDEYLPFGVFFAVVGIGQLVAAAAVLLRPERRLFLTVAAAEVLLAGLWWLSRTTGLPVGPEPWSPEPIGVPDVICVLVEVVGAAVLLGLALRGPRPHRRHPLRTPCGVGLVAVVGAAATFVGVGTGLSGMPVASSANPPGAEAGGVPVTALVAPPSGAEPVRVFTLTARPSTIDGHPAFTYDGTVPGPELRVTQGDRVRVTLVNRLPVATTLHWHGVQVPGAEDGVAGITQDAVGPGKTFTYEFVATDAGTFWYHSHQDTAAQISAGLFGALVVEPPGGHVAEQVDQVAVLHSDVAGIAVNGTTGDLHVPTRPGQTVRLRVIDAVAPGMDGTAEAPALLGVPYKVVALDGHDLSGPQPLGRSRLVLGMGQRVDLVFTVPAVGSVRLVDSRVAGSPSALEGFFGPQARADETVTIGDGPPPATVDPTTLPVFDPLTYGAPAPDPTTTRPPDVTVPVVLAEGPGFRDGSIQLVHTINGAASPDVPPLVVRSGQLVGLHMVNDTGEFHPMHLHGHVMTVLAVDGRAPQGSPVHQDTVLLGPHQTVDVVFPADNPGIWMLHCHVPLHAEMGMSMTVDYAGITTPFTMGSRSGNIPE